MRTVAGGDKERNFRVQRKGGPAEGGGPSEGFGVQGLGFFQGLGFRLRVQGKGFGDQNRNRTKRK